MSVTPQGRKIAIVGASGTLGKPLLASLAKVPGHTVTAVQRADATSTFPPSVRVVAGDLASPAFLESAFKDQDVVVLMPPLSHLVSLQDPAVRAAAKVGVPYVFPSEFGPDPFATELIEANGLLQAKKQVRDLIEELGVSSWVSVAFGPWIEYGVGAGLWGVDPKKRTATIWKGADGKANSSTVKFSGEALAAVLSLPEADLAKLRNKAVYAPALRFSQRELLEAAKKVAGGDWTVEERDVKDVQREYEAALAKGDEAAAFTKFFVTHLMEGMGADFEHKVDRELERKLKSLGLGEESLEDAIRSILA
ncbi:hypothetical protein PWT90_07263 [Aphanocladium album]|nr:hypothetical protein PWT90_07263 [Aphanocladium album]